MTELEALEQALQTHHAATEPLCQSGDHLDEAVDVLARLSLMGWALTDEIDDAEDRDGRHQYQDV